MNSNEDNVLFEFNPRARHSIHISGLNRQLMRSLADFFGEGIQRGDLCIAILTPRHRRSLNRLLRSKDIDIGAATKSEQYFTLNAKNVLAMADFDETAYHQTIENISDLAAWKDQRVRAFGEVIGLRWPKLGSRFGLYVPQNE